MTSRSSLLSIGLGILFAFNPVLFFAQAALPSPSPVPSGNNLDDFFNDIQKDTVVVGPQPEGGSSLPTRPVFLYYGNVETQGALADGWTAYTPHDTASSYDAYLHLKGGIDVQPAPQLRIIGSFSSYLPQSLDPTMISNLTNGTTESNLTTGTTQTINTTYPLSLDELFIDYNVADEALFRIGRYTLTWGQGRIFNPGNLMGDTAGSYNVKGFTSIGPVSLTGVAIVSSNFTQVLSNIGLDQIGYGELTEVALGPVTAGLSAYHQELEGTTGDLYLRTNIFGFDLYTDMLEFQHSTKTDWYTAPWSPSIMVGTYREFGDSWRFRMVAEYWLNDSGPGACLQNLGIGLNTDPMIPGLDVKLNMKWTQSLTPGDPSGQLVTGLTMTPFPLFEVGLGVPWTYGPPTGAYIVNNSDTAHRLLAILLTVSLKASFEKAR